MTSTQQLTSWRLKGDANITVFIFSCCSFMSNSTNWLTENHNTQSRKIPIKIFLCFRSQVTTMWQLTSWLLAEDANATVELFTRCSFVSNTTNRLTQIHDASHVRSQWKSLFALDQKWETRQLTSWRLVGDANIALYIFTCSSFKGIHSTHLIRSKSKSCLFMSHKCQT